nr:PEP/pyruvate-binding domain-containing protein [Rhodococcus opacus]
MAYRTDETITPPVLLKEAESLAVRSSGLSEDSVTLSSAGSFLTELGVKFDAVEAAAARVRASARGKPMGVVIQELVPAAVSGVAFSVDPTSYSLDSWAVSWVEGLGDGLVSGRSTGNDVLVAWSNGIPRYGTWPLREDLLEQIGTALKDLARELAGPVDVEWCVDSAGELIVLQVRPIVLPDPGVQNLDSAAAFLDLPSVVSGHPKISLRRRAAELGVEMTPSRATVATSREHLPQPPMTRSPAIAGSSVVLLHPFTVGSRVIREFAKIDRSDVEFFTAECRRYSIRDYPSFENITDTETRVATMGLSSAAVAVVLEQEIWDAEVTGIIRASADGYLLEVGLGHFVPKGYVETSAYVVDKAGWVLSRREVRQSVAFHFVNGHVIREVDPPESPWLTADDIVKVVETLGPLIEVEPQLALEFGITKRGEGGIVYLIDAAESDHLSVDLGSDDLERGIVSRGHAGGPIVDLRGNAQVEDLHAHLYQSVVGDAPDEPTIFIASSASVDLLPLLEACPPGCGFLFEEASLLAHFAVVLRERGVPGVVVTRDELDRLGGDAFLDTESTPILRSGRGR